MSGYLVLKTPISCYTFLHWIPQKFWLKGLYSVFDWMILFFLALGPSSKTKEEANLNSTSVAPSNVNYGAAQMWSLGVIVWELITRQIPFVDMNKFHIGFKVSLKFSFNLFLNLVASRFVKAWCDQWLFTRQNFDQWLLTKKICYYHAVYVANNGSTKIRLK